MAIALITRRVFGHTTLSATLLNGATATGNGEWVNVAGFYPLTIHVKGITTATVEVDGSNEPAQPNDNTHGFKLNDLTADGGVVVDVPVEWVKCRVTAYTSGTISAYMLGSEEAV